MSPSKCVSGLSPENSPETEGRLSPVSLPYKGETETKSPGENRPDNLDSCRCCICRERNTAGEQSADAPTGNVDTRHGIVGDDPDENLGDFYPATPSRNGGSW
jgi:hypothetical protein